jgi:hypothetical protein
VSRRTAVAVALVLSTSAAGAVYPAAGQGADAPPAESRDPPRLRLDVDRHVERVLAEAKAAGEIPRFEEKIEVREPGVMLTRFLQDEDLRYGPTGGGPPTTAETMAYRPGPTPGANFLAVLQWLFEKAREFGPPRFFLYRVGASGKQWYALYEEKVPRERQAARPDVVYELIESFTDRGRAVAAWKRLERGEPARGGGVFELWPAPPSPLP